MTTYKIRHKETGLYKSGTHFALWSKDGKTWSSLRNLRLHLGMLDQYDPRGSDKWEVIPFEMFEGKPLRIQEI